MWEPAWKITYYQQTLQKPSNQKRSKKYFEELLNPKGGTNRTENTEMSYRGVEEEQRDNIKEEEKKT